MSGPGNSGGQIPSSKPSAVFEPRLRRVRTPQQFRARMVELKERNGLSLDDLHRRSGGTIPRSTLANNLDANKTTMPTREFVVGYIQASGLDQDAVNRWVTTWEQVRSRNSRTRVQRLRQAITSTMSVPRRRLRRALVGVPVVLTKDPPDMPLMR